MAVAPDELAVDDEAVARLARVLAPVGALREAVRLTGGFFATTYRATLKDGRRVIVKTAPVADDRLLTYEHDLLRAEALVYGLASEHPGLLMPPLLHVDYSREVMPGDVVVAGHLDGIPWDRAGYVPDDPRAFRTRHELGALMARLHAVTGPRFGYVGEGSPVVGATWPEAFGRYIEALLADAVRWDVPLPADEVRAALARHHDALSEVTVPALVHGDLWPGNLFVDPATGRLLGVIDAERAQWADPLVELVGADQVGRDTTPAGLLAGYADEAGRQLDVSSDGAVRRLALYRVHMSLVWLVEATPRGYDGDFVTWYRQVAGDNLRAALDVLA